MILYCRQTETLFEKNLLRTLDFGKVVIRYANRLHLAAMEQRDKERSPTFHVCRVVNPIDVDGVRTEAVKTSGEHLLHGIGYVGGYLRRKLRREDDAVTIIRLGKFTQMDRKALTYHKQQ